MRERTLNWPEKASELSLSRRTFILCVGQKWKTRAARGIYSVVELVAAKSSSRGHSSSGDRRPKGERWLQDISVARRDASMLGRLLASVVDLKKAFVFGLKVFIIFFFFFFCSLRIEAALYVTVEKKIILSLRCCRVLRNSSKNS